MSAERNREARRLASLWVADELDTKGCAKLYSWVLERLDGWVRLGGPEETLWVFIIIGTEIKDLANCQTLIRCARAS